MVKIFIDPGHGGDDAGAVGDGLQEKNITLQIATRIKNILLVEYNNVEVKMSRTSDECVSLNERTDAPTTGMQIIYYLFILTLAAGQALKVISILVQVNCLSHQYSRCRNRLSRFHGSR
ncbi:N-acetylmuramoyl-L-alanine amidase [Bacillus sp. OV194]|nr:N-acetylmuramoyl-L-alanine amidase [Bacillus sp. OV194]